MGGKLSNRIVSLDDCSLGSRRLGVERAIATIAGLQHNAINRPQLRAVGLGDQAINTRIRSGRLQLVHRGVYLIGPVRAEFTAEAAAVLACGPNGHSVRPNATRAWISHESAPHLHGLLPHFPTPGAVHVTVVGSAIRRPGITVHRVQRHFRDEVQVVHGLPASTPARMILDLAARLRTSDLELMVADALRRRLASQRQLLLLVARHRGHPGCRDLRTLLQGGSAPAFTRSKAERLFLGLVRRAGLPVPRVNQQVCGHEVDFLWPDQRLIVEVDGHAFHSHRPERERDARRDQELMLRDYRVMRITWRQITSEPEALVVRVAIALAVGDQPGLPAA